jgi:hypothetical protein
MANVLVLQACGLDEESERRYLFDHFVYREQAERRVSLKPYESKV